MKVYTNQTNVLEGSTAVVEHKDEDQEVQLELTDSHSLRTSSTHIISILLYLSKGMNGLR
jgi:hypothetical protein